MIRQRHFIAVVGTFLIGCAVLVVAGCAAVRSQAPQEEKQDHTEATASEEARCSQTRTFRVGSGPYGGPGEVWTTNDVPGCPNGGMLSGTDGRDHLDGKDGDDEIRGLGGVDDDMLGGGGNDVIYGGPGDNDRLSGDRGDDVIDAGDGDDRFIWGAAGDVDLAAQQILAIVQLRKAHAFRLADSLST